MGALLDAFSEDVLGSSYATHQGTTSSEGPNDARDLQRGSGDAVQDEWAQIVRTETWGGRGKSGAGYGHARARHDQRSIGDDDDDYDAADMDQEGGESARHSLEGTLKGLRETQGQLKKLVRRAHVLQKAQQQVSGLVTSVHMHESQEDDSNQHQEDDSTQVQSER